MTAYERSDKQYYFVPCPSTAAGTCRACSGGQDTRYRVKPHYDEKRHFVLAYYMCEACEELIPDDPDTRAWMDQNGKWRATAVAARKGIRGMHISALYSQAPKVSWSILWKGGWMPRATRTF